MIIKREIVIQWINEILKKPLHTKLYIQVESKENARKGVTDFNREISVLAKIDPEKSGTLFVSFIYKDKKYWIVLERIIGNPLVGFIKNPSGEMERVTIEYDPERERRIFLMFEEGFSIEEVESAEGKLTESEKRLYRGK